MMKDDTEQEFEFKELRDRLIDIAKLFKDYPKLEIDVRGKEEWGYLYRI